MNKKQQLILLLAILFMVNISKAVTYYWVGGAGNWSDINRWSTTSGGPGNQPVVPGINDDVVFDANSGFTSTSRIVIVNVIANCHNMTWTGALNTPTITAGAINLLNIYGSLTLQSGMAYNVQQSYFKSSASTESITTNGTTINGNIYIESTGTVYLMDATNIINNFSIYLVKGGLNTNNNTINCAGLYPGSNPFTTSLNLPNTFTLTLGSSVITIRNQWSYYGTGAILNAGTSHIILDNGLSSVSNTSFNSQSGHIFNNITFNEDASNISIAAGSSSVKIHRAVFNQNATLSSTSSNAFVIDSLLLKN